MPAMVLTLETGNKRNNSSDRPSYCLSLLMTKVSSSIAVLRAWE